MNLLLILAQIYIPAFYKKKKLDELFGLTARAFSCPVPDIEGLSYGESLKVYAQFTKEKAEDVTAKGGNPENVKSRLYRNAYELGERLKKDFHIKTNTDVITICKILYKILDIEFQYEKTGTVKFKRCYFSGFYTAGVCGIISSLDEGVAAGLSDGGKLVFQGRLTEGKECCSATFTFRDNL